MLQHRPSVWVAVCEGPVPSALLQGISELRYTLAEHPHCMLLLTSAHPRRSINRALCYLVRAPTLVLDTVSALSPWWRGTHIVACPANLDASLSLLLDLCHHIATALQPSFLSSNAPELSLTPSSPIQLGATILNVRSVTLLHTACTGRRDGLLAFPGLSFVFNLLSNPVLSLSVSRALFRVARASIETVQCSIQTSLSTCLSSSLGKCAILPPHRHS